MILDPSKNVNPEIIGWDLTIKKIIYKGTNTKNKIAIVVDSELGKLSDINSRKTPYYRSEKLPKNLSFIYASSDNPTETIPSKPIKICDNHADKIAEQVKTCGLSSKINPGDENYSDWYCIAPK